MSKNYRKCRIFYPILTAPPQGLGANLLGDSQVGYVWLGYINKRFYMFMSAYGILQKITEYHFPTDQFS
jgi:hypothetical protein